MNESLNTARSIHRLFAGACLLLIFAGAHMTRNEETITGKENDQPESIELFGLEIPADMGWYVGPLIVLGLQLWFLAHLFHLREKIGKSTDAARDFPWMVLFAGRFSRVLTCVTNVLFPLLAYLSLRIFEYLFVLGSLLFDGLGTWNGLIVGGLAGSVSSVMAFIISRQIAHLWSDIHGRSYFKP